MYWQGGNDNGNVVFGISYTGCQAQYPGKSSALFEAERPVSYTHLTLPTKRIVENSAVAVSLTKKADDEEDSEELSGHQNINKKKEEQQRLRENRREKMQQG